MGISGGGNVRGQGHTIGGIFAGGQASWSAGTGGFSVTGMGALFGLAVQGQYSTVSGFTLYFGVGAVVGVGNGGSFFAGAGYNFGGGLLGYSATGPQMSANVRGNVLGQSVTYSVKITPFEPRVPFVEPHFNFNIVGVNLDDRLDLNKLDPSDRLAEKISILNGMNETYHLTQVSREAPQPSPQPGPFSPVRDNHPASAPGYYSPSPQPGPHTPVGDYHHSSPSKPASAPSPQLGPRDYTGPNTGYDTPSEHIPMEARPGHFASAPSPQPGPHSPVGDYHHSSLSKPASAPSSNPFGPGSMAAGRAAERASVSGNAGSSSKSTNTYSTSGATQSAKQGRQINRIQHQQG